MTNDYLYLIEIILRRETEGITLTNQFILLILEVLAVFGSGIILHKKKYISYRRLFQIFLLVAYAGVLMSFTVLRRQPGSRIGIVNLDVDLGVTANGIYSIWKVIFNGLNIILFVPWGFVVCSFFKNRGFLFRILASTVIGSVTSLFLECIQLLTGTGRFEVNDLITNTVGTFIGAVILAVGLSIMNIRGRRKKDIKERRDLVKKKLSILVGIILIAAAAMLRISHGDEDILKRNYNTTFFSNFNIPNVFKFRKSTWGAAQKYDLVWKAENVQYKDGKMSLKIDRDEAGPTGGEISTKKKFGFGLYQVRMKSIKNNGVVSAFFNYSRDGQKGTEIDIEFLGYDTTKVQFDYYTDCVGGHEYLYDLGFDSSEEYHDYAFDWSKDSIKWYVDGEMVYEANTDIPQMEAYIFMSAWPGDFPDWLREYDGKVPLYAYYDWCSYTSKEQVENDISSNEESKTE
ncbi:VanZ family protein [Butyrivibrio sp. AC2005]|uniref:VanZ family protein n=1 Tax=Butyrivibrio sp. AC2005 TaxID=1280672 RepID=UPI00041FCD0A|nr:VanZ family protein [Butyrivibrio sp. AC2005]